MCSSDLDCPIGAHCEHLPGAGGGVAGGRCQVCGVEAHDWRVLGLRAAREHHLPDLQALEEVGAELTPR